MTIGLWDGQAGHRAVAEIVVCVPTYRRPRQLARLLEALGMQRTGRAFDILVGNNEERALTTYAELRDDALPAFRVIDVAMRGVSAVRNALIDDVLARPGPIRWIACLDDDQIPSPDWLERIVSAGEHHDADLVGGPVRRTLSTQTFWSHGAADTSYLPRHAGPIPTLNEAGNLLMATRFLRALGRPPFSLDFGRTGGEDYEFFLFAGTKGARIVWAPDAHVEEPLPADRLTLGSFAWRFYAIAAYQARADRRYRGTFYVLAAVVRDAVKCPLLIVRSLWRDRDARRAIGLLIRSLALVAGRLAGLFGIHAERYGGQSPAQIAQGP